MQNAERCEWCGDQGMIPVFHREYRGEALVFVEHINNRTGEASQHRMPGTMAVHCLECALGRWMRDNTKPEIRDRIRTSREVIEGSIPYSFERPNSPDLITNPEEGRLFLARFRRIGEKLKAEKLPGRKSIEQIQQELRAVAGEKPYAIGGDPSYGNE